MENRKNILIDKISPLKIIELSYKHPRKLNILAIAPLTNIATALMLDPSLPNRINKIIIMGGSYSSLGNIKSNVEFNFASDPIAAKKVFSSFNKNHNEIIVYPWESCLEFLILKEHISLIEKEKCENDTKRYVEKILHKKEFYPETGIFADFGSAVYMINENSVKNSKRKYVDVSIESDDSTFGQFIFESDYSVKNQEKEREKVVEYVRENEGECCSSRKKVEVIMNLNKEAYYDCFVKMVKN